MLDRPGRGAALLAAVLLALAALLHRPTRHALVDLALGVADALDDDDV